MYMSKRSGMYHTVLPANTPCLPFIRKRLPDGATITQACITQFYLQIHMILIHHHNNNGAIIMAKPLQEFTRFIWWMQTQRRGGHQSSDQANRLGLWVRQKEMAATVHIHHHHLLLLSPRADTTEGGRLSRPRHCSKGVQPVPKAVYRSGCRDKHYCPWWDSNLDPLTVQSGMLPLGHCDTDLDSP